MTITPPMLSLALGLAAIVFCAQLANFSVRSWPDSYIFLRNWYIAMGSVVVLRTGLVELGYQNGWLFAIIQLGLVGVLLFRRFRRPT